MAGSGAGHDAKRASSRVPFLSSPGEDPGIQTSSSSSPASDPGIRASEGGGGAGRAEEGAVAGGPERAEGGDPATAAASAAARLFAQGRTEEAGRLLARLPRRPPAATETGAGDPEAVAATLAPAERAVWDALGYERWVVPPGTGRMPLADLANDWVTPADRWRVLEELRRLDDPAETARVLARFAEAGLDPGADHPAFAPASAPSSPGATRGFTSTPASSPGEDPGIQALDGRVEPGHDGKNDPSPHFSSSSSASEPRIQASPSSSSSGSTRGS
ncbi:MAG: hypothetical protein NZ704_15215, partial [Geminicoccaceae bacterium]|nr:hypothetical protein [Geminicoccaceae bacterium]